MAEAIEVPPLPLLPGSYASEIRANLKDHFNCFELDPEPTDYSSLRNSLTAEVREWRAFGQQADALDCASKLAHLGVMTFTYHHCNSSRRFFLVTHPLELWYRSRNRPNCYNYEIIAEERPSKLYLDLEFDPVCNPNHDGVKMTDTFNKIILHILGEDFYLSLDHTHILNLDSTTKKKFSRHIIFQLPFPLAFKSNIEAGSVVIKACNLIRDTLDPDSETNICEKFNIPRSDLEMLEIKDKKGNISLFVDEGVYTKNRHFRLYGSTKFGRNAPLILSPENQFTVPVATQYLYHEYILMASLVTYSTMVGIVIPVTELPKPVIPTKPLPTLTYKSDKSPFPVLDTFVMRIICPCTIDVVLHYENGSILVYVTREAGFCSNVGRQHKKNRVMYIVHIRRGLYFQKCHDPDCRDYASPKSVLPVHLQIEIGLEWDMWDEAILNAFDDGPDVGSFVHQIKMEVEEEYMDSD